MYCGQTVGWIKMKRDMDVGLNPVHIAFDGDPAPPKRGTAPPLIFGPCISWPNDWMHQDTTWYGGRLRPRLHCARWEPNPHKKMETPPIFGPCLLWPNGRPSQLLLSSCFWFSLAYFVPMLFASVVLGLVSSVLRQEIG